MLHVKCLESWVTWHCRLLSFWHIFLNHFGIFRSEGFSAKEWNRCMESAYEHYLQASSTRLAMRVHSAVFSCFLVLCDFQWQIQTPNLPCAGGGLAPSDGVRHQRCCIEADEGHQRPSIESLEFIWGENRSMETWLTTT